MHASVFIPHWYCFSCLLSDYHLKYSLNLFLLSHFDNFQLFHFLLLFSLFYFYVLFFFFVSKMKDCQSLSRFLKKHLFLSSFSPRPAYVFVSYCFIFSLGFLLSSHSSLLGKSVKSFLLIIARPSVVKYIAQDRGGKRERKVWSIHYWGDYTKVCWKMSQARLETRDFIYFSLHTRDTSV